MDQGHLEITAEKFVKIACLNGLNIHIGSL